MAAARYWRAVGLSAYGGGDVELSALHLYESFGDPAYGSVSSLLHFDGANGSTTFTDDGPSPRSVSSVGGAALSTAQSRFGGSSLRVSFGSHVSIADHESLNMPEGDFTIEMWVYPVTLSANGILFNKQSGTASGYPWQAYVSPTGSVVFRSYTASSVERFTVTTSGGQVAAEVWTHLAFVRSGSTFSVYANGSLAGSATYSGSLPENTEAMVLGAYSNAVAPFDGYIDDFRLTKGVARYVSAFTPPTSSFPNALADGSFTRVDQDATLTCSLSPVSGAIANLQDTDLATVARVSARESGLALVWDFGPGVEKTVAGVGVGSAADITLFLSHVDIQSSLDGVTWTQVGKFGRFAWLGANTFTAPTEAPLALILRTEHVAVEMFVATGLPTGMPTTPLADSLSSFRDFEFGGFGRIAGTVKKDATPDIPLKRRVRLHREQDGLLVREVWSDQTTGAYSFDYIDATKQYTVITYDYLHDYRAVIADNITPEAMP